MKKYYFFLIAGSFLFMLSCSAPKNNDSLAIQDGFPLVISKYNIILAIDKNGLVQQMEYDETGKIVERHKIKIKNVKSIGFHSISFMPLGWALKSNGQLFTWPIIAPDEIKQIDYGKPIAKVVSNDRDDGHLAILFADSTVLSSIFNVGNEWSKNKPSRDSLHGIIDIAVSPDVLVSLDYKDSLKAYRIRHENWSPGKEVLKDITKIGVTQNLGTLQRYTTDCFYTVDEKHKIHYLYADRYRPRVAEIEGENHYIFSYMALNKKGELSNFFNFPDSYGLNNGKVVYYYCHNNYNFCYWLGKDGRLNIKNRKTGKDVIIDGMKLRMDFFKGVEGVK